MVRLLACSGRVCPGSFQEIGIVSPDYHPSPGSTRVIASFLFGVRAWDPVVFVGAAVILSAVALMAVWVPATGTSKVDPMQALRAE
jgi:ABC-type lipoprotein release transport system permease subunit